MNRPQYISQMPPPPPPSTGQMMSPNVAIQGPPLSNHQMPPQPISNSMRPPPPPGNSMMPPRQYPPQHQVRMGHPMAGGGQYPSSPNRPPMVSLPQSGPPQPSQSPMHSGGKRSAAQAMVNPGMKQMSGGGGIVPPNTVAPGSNASMHGPIAKKKKKISDKILPQKVRDLVPESQAYMDLIAFERKLDFTIMRKRMDIQEALKKPIKQKRKLRIFVTNTFYPGKNDPEGNEEPIVPSWELRVEGRLLDDKPDSSSSSKALQKRKFSTFFKSLVIELDKELYGPDNHLVEWHRSVNTAETDGFQVKRPGDRNVRCTILFMLDYQPMQYKLDPRLSRLLGIYANTRPVIIQAFWQYVKKNRLQDTHEREYINCDQYLEQIFNAKRIKFAEFPSRLNHFLQPPDPIIINHQIVIEGHLDSLKKVSCYDIEVEVDDPLKSQMQNFLLSIASQQEILALEQKNHETVDSINHHKTSREFYLGFASDPQQFIHKWLISQVRDLKVMTDQSGNPEEERLSDFFYQPWTQEAVCRYFYSKVQQRRIELEQALGIRN
ncbi:brahma-associated protein 60 [Dermatophagoides farinae]|uniref:SWI SNF, matrix associated, actin dependent regulator of chromatin, sub d, member 2 n=1 Tax=Dermatophagoides farinae TaxID=6954 RepID=A0A922HZ86_DERFA|nr:SWI SNF, matrix associated, actin dependent regulator of chromatin, sub d, member 2 [Dermatophagoides farinae]